MTIKFLKISIILLILNYCNSFEYRYIPNSEEYDKKLMLNSIFKSKNHKFVSRFDLNKLKNRRFDVNFNEETRQDNVKPNKIIQNDNKFDKHNNNNQTTFILQNESEESDYLQQNETNLINQIILPSSTLIPSQYESALSYDAKNYSDIFNQKPVQQNFYNITNYNNSDPLNKLPIYFTNPVTGIVYAITEVGQNYTKLSNISVNLNDTNSIPIYIPKEQYDRDMNLLKLDIMQQCRLGKNRKNQIKGSNFSKLVSTTVKPMKTLLKPIKSPVKNPVKKRKKIKPTIDDDISGPFSDIGDVFDEVFNVIEDSGSSSEENGVKLKTINQNNKIIKQKIQNKPNQTTTFIKNGNQTVKILNNKFFRTQVEKPITKTTTNPIIGQTTMQSFVSLIPLRTSKRSDSSHNGFSLRSAKRHISKRSIHLPKSTVPTMFNEHKSIRRIKPFRSTIPDNYITEIPIVRYTTPTPDEFYTKIHRNFKRSIRTSTLKEQQLTTEIPQTVNTVPIELEPIKKVKKTKLKKVNKRNGTVMTTTITTPFIENYTETPRQQQTITTIHKYTEKINEIFKLPVTSAVPSAQTTQSPLATITIPTSTLMPKKQKIKYDDEYDDYLINYDDLPFVDEYDKKDESSVEDENDDDSYSDEDSTESDEYLGHEISEINIIDPQRIEQIKNDNENKRKRKRKPDNDNLDDYDEEDDYNDENDMVKFFKLFFYPARVVWDNIVTKAGDLTNKLNDPVPVDKDDYDDEDKDDYLIEDNKNRKPKFPKYTLYSNKLSNVGEETSGNSWFNSWFGSSSSEDSNKNEENISEISINPSPEAPGWFDNWFGYDERSSTTPAASIEDYDDDDGYIPEWFSNWFDSAKQKKTNKNKPALTTTPTTPLLTISNPMKNPQKWIGILAQHIVNSTSAPNSVTSPQFEDDEPQLITYDKYQIWRLKPFDDSQVKVLQNYKNSGEGSKLQWLQGPTVRGLTDVLIPPKLRTNFQGTLNFEAIAHEVLIFDVGKAIEYETKDNSFIDSSRNSFVWKKYQTYDKIIRFIENLQIRNPNLIELYHIGRSFEGRPLVIVKISIKEAGKKKYKLKHKNNRNNGVFIEAGIHGREWITPATASWIINNIVKIMKSNQTTSDAEFIKKMTWYILPVLNPDGYEYSHEYDRMWRKSRSKHFAKPNGLLNTAMTWFQQTKLDKVCFGVDLDQNWNYKLMEQADTKSPCNEFFAGPNSFSEPETKAVSKFLMDHRKKIKLFISLHAYGQIISYPNKLNTSFSSQKMDDLLDVAMVGNDGLRKSGSNARYKIDLTNDLIAAKLGSSTHFAMYEAGIPFSYTIHLGDNGVHGYLLPSSNIESTAKDAFQIIKAMVDYI